MKNKACEHRPSFPVRESLLGKSPHRQIRRLGRWLLSIVVLIFLSFSFLPSARADSVKSMSGNKDAVLTYARALIEKDETNRSNMRKAASFLEKCQAKFPGVEQIRLYLAEAYQKRGDKAAAIREWNEILDVSRSGNPFVEKARTMLAALD